MKSGPEQLKDWMHRRRFMQREAGEYFGWDETYVSQLVNGRRSPGLENAIQIERMTGIPVEAWSSSLLDTPENAEPVSAGKAHKSKA
jgi:transcriptional regulator with XRE-family HTH domain